MYVTLYKWSTQSSRLLLNFKDYRRQIGDTLFLLYLDTTLKGTLNLTWRTLTRHLSLLQPYLISKGLLKISHGSYSPTTFALPTNLSLLCQNYWPALRIETNRSTDGEQFILQWDQVLPLQPTYIGETDRNLNIWQSICALIQVNFMHEFRMRWDPRSGSEP